VAGTQVQRHVLRLRIGDQNAAVVQGCVPTVSLKGDSYRLRGKELDARMPAKPSDLD
jgi:hypothetical protein